VISDHHADLHFTPACLRRAGYQSVSGAPQIAREGRAALSEEDDR
jgi:hypothetical protein